VVMVAGMGELVVELQPDQVPVHEENGPQPAVQVVHESQLTPLAFVPQGPQPPMPPGPPEEPQAPGPPPLPPQAPGPPQGPWPFQPVGAEGRSVEKAEIQLDHWPEFQPPLGPKPPGPAVISEGQAEPPEVALKVACWELVTGVPALAQSCATAP